MGRESLLLLAVSMLIAAAAVVGISGWVLVVRDRRLARAGVAISGTSGIHPEDREER